MSPARRAGWTWLAAVVVVTGTVAMLLPAGRGGTGRSLWLGVVAAVLLLVCALLGARKRFLRLRLGSVAAWTSAHNGLGAIALVLGLLHAQFQRGDVITTALLVTLGLVVVIGTLGLLLQAQVPRVMTARLPRETAHSEVDPILDQWRQLHEHLVAECGPLPDAERALRDAEEARGLSRPETVHRETARPSGAGRRAIASFYTAEMLPLLVSSGTKGALSSTSTAQLAMDALRADVDPSLHALVAQLETTVMGLHAFIEERRLHGLVFNWQLIHIPLAMVVMLLLVVHVAAALYY